jgi:prefoldin subunit 5|tara:strand:+ start:700 stop:948 length:249 start_codon:yes stop_codon:yes gene_type:complete
MLKKIAKGVWTFSLEKGWNWVWSKTTVDEKVEAAVEEAGKRIKAMKEEAKDVAKAVKEVGNQIGDVADAAAGKKRRGRPKSK